MNPNQIAIPVDVRPDEIARKQTLGAAIELCAELGGHSLDKTLQQALEVDKAQFSRWQNGTEGILWPKLVRLMDACGNDAPILWMVHQRGFDLYAMRRRESELEQELRQAKEKIRQMEHDRAVEIRALREVRALA